MRQNVYKDASFRMSKDRMADVMYAVIMTDARLVSTFTLGKEYSRKQNTYNNAWIKVHIEDTKIPLFEQLSGIKLEEPERISGASGGDKW
jgi:hypothetical protein